MKRLNEAFVPIEEAIKLLRANEPVAIPTETVYGLAARIASPEAISKVFALKGRPSDNPLIIHICNTNQIYSLAHVTPAAESSMKAFWPGPLTIVLNHNGSVLPVVTAGLDTAAFRMPSHPVCLDILRMLGEPVAAPSANKSGRPSPTRPEHVFHDFDGAVPVVDGGACSIGLESTVIRAFDDDVMILRPGAVTREMLVDAGIGVRDTVATEKQRSPGTRYRHYAPDAVIRLFYHLNDVKEHVEKLSSPYVILVDEHYDMPSGVSAQFSANIRVLSAESLYAELRRADDLHLSEILVLCSDVILQNDALMNRLNIAAS